MNQELVITWTPILKELPDDQRERARQLIERYGETSPTNFIVELLEVFGIHAAYLQTVKLVILSPLLISWFGPPVSIAQLTILPSGSLTSTYNRPCGLIHSIFVSVPFRVTGLSTSNSAEKA